MAPPPCRRWLDILLTNTLCTDVIDSLAWVEVCVYFAVVTASSVVVDTIDFNVGLICVGIACYTDLYRLIAVYRPLDYLSYV